MHCFSGRRYIAPKPFTGKNIREIRILLPFSENYWPANLYGLTKLPLHVFNQSLGQIWALHKIGALSIRQKFQLPFPELFRWRLEQHFSELEWKRTILRGNFCITWLSSRNFRLKGSLFVNFTIYGFSRNFSRKFPFHLSLFRNFRIFLLNRIFFHGASAGQSTGEVCMAKFCCGLMYRTGRRGWVSECVRISPGPKLWRQNLRRQKAISEFSWASVSKRV